MLYRGTSGCLAFSVANDSSFIKTYTTPDDTVILVTWMFDPEYIASKQHVVRVNQVELTSTEMMGGSASTASPGRTLTFGGDTRY